MRLPRPTPGRVRTSPPPTRRMIALGLIGVGDREFDSSRTSIGSRSTSRPVLGSKRRRVVGRRQCGATASQCSNGLYEEFRLQGVHLSGFPQRKRQIRFGQNFEMLRLRHVDALRLGSASISMSNPEERYEELRKPIAEDAALLTRQRRERLADGCAPQRRRWRPVAPATNSRRRLSPWPSGLPCARRFRRSVGKQCSTCRCCRRR